jgi:hypothetical protein
VVGVDLLVLGAVTRLGRAPGDTGEAWVAGGGDTGGDARVGEARILGARMEEIEEFVSLVGFSATDSGRIATRETPLGYDPCPLLAAGRGLEPSSLYHSTLVCGFLLC